MSHVAIRKVANIEDRSLPVFAEMDRIFDEIRLRASDFFRERSVTGEHALEDWLRAEHEVCWPAAELVEHEKDYKLSFALPGFEPSDIELTVTPREVILHGRVVKSEKKEQETVCWSEFRSNDVYRRIEFASDIDTDKVTAWLKSGMLTVVAPKSATAARKVPLASAA